MSFRSLLPLTFLTALVASASATACASRGGAEAKTPTVAELRKNAEHDTKQTSAWLLAELVSPDGSPERAKQARQALDKAQAKGPLGRAGARPRRFFARPFEAGARAHAARRSGGPR